MKPPLLLGVDIGSTTIKMVGMDDKCQLLFAHYQRHYSDIKNAFITMIEQSKDYCENHRISLVLSGSAGIGIAQKLDFPFVQEVIASTHAIEKWLPETDVAIELGGEDAKITYFGKTLEQRMNGICAGGTGSFIDQMAFLLQTDAQGLNEYAKSFKTILPVASRCGVFAKSDIQPMLNEGASKEDVAASVFQAVVNQTISGLAQGKPIRGNIAFLGGPLFFLSELRKRFIATLRLSDHQIFFPEHALYFVSMGAAMCAQENAFNDFSCLYHKVYSLNGSEDTTHRTQPLFRYESDYTEFVERHAKNSVETFPLESYRGPAFLGIDAGSTTTKLALVDSEGRLLYSYYDSNRGSPLYSTLYALQSLCQSLHDGVVIARTAVTGYGEKLIQNAFRVDEGEIETVAHYKAARHFLPDVDFVLDIGGQDMKSLRITDGVIDSIMLNEACSSGCGSFIETFAKSVNMDVEEFANKGVSAKSPVDLGTRCTVFMNSKVKQVQKEGATLEDLSAGIALSVIKNALFKVMRIRTVEDLDEKIVVQGGTFANQSVLRALEQILGRNVVRPDICGIMGAFGAALIAKEKWQEGETSTLLCAKDLEKFQVQVTNRRCTLCGNQCLLTVNDFMDGRQYITGNRCERGAGLPSLSRNLPDLYDYKYTRVFAYESLSTDTARLGSIGIPRVLNMYEDYPFWHTFFTHLGYRVVLSSRSSKALCEKGMETIPSESVCYPAKLVHGHIEDLIEKGVECIFYPGIPWNMEEDTGAQNSYNCPIVISYAEIIRTNIAAIREGKVRFYNPFLPLYDKDKMRIRVKQELTDLIDNPSQIPMALEKAYEALEVYKADVRQKGEETIALLHQNDKKGIVLAGRPYHIDPEIHNGIPQLIRSLGFAVLSEDSIAHLGSLERPLRVVDQWLYYNRMYRAASYVARQPQLELVQLNSFGCGLDALTTDQIKEILDRYGKLFTVLKIDEITNLGAARIRLRSLAAAIKEREGKKHSPHKKYDIQKRPLFTKAMKTRHTILIPQMSPIHFQFIRPAFEKCGYSLDVLPAHDDGAVDIGLRYVNNDACYPSIIVVGQIMKALQSGQYDLDDTTVLMTQTGGACRATNYIAFIRKALKDAGLEHIPTLAISLQRLETNPGFHFSPKMTHHLLMGFLLADMLMRMLYRVRPYEKVSGSANALAAMWEMKIRNDLYTSGWKAFKRNCTQMVRDFDQLDIYTDSVKPRVGVVGEILVKYHPTANNDVIGLIESEGAEAVVPDLIDFLMYALYNKRFNYRRISWNIAAYMTGVLGMRIVEYYRKPMRKALEKSARFTSPRFIDDIAKGAAHHLSLSNQAGEGWLLTGEMVELIQSGVNNIICLQPFGCLPNHITGKGMVKELRQSYPSSNIVTVDYDPGASEINQINRIKLMLSVAFKNLEQHT